MPHVFPSHADGTNEIISASHLNTIQAAIVSLEGEMYNVAESSYGAKGDMRTVADGVWTNGSATVTSATAAFVAGDVGKIIALTNTVNRTVFNTYISARVSATQITLSNTMADATVASGGLLHFGTENTAHINTAITDCSNAGGGFVMVPPGVYLTQQVNLKAGVILCGAGRDASVIVDPFDAGPMISALNITNCGIRDLKIVSTIYLDFSSGMTVDGCTNLLVENIHFDTSTTAINIQNSSKYVALRNLLITNMRKTSGGQNGAGVWFFKGVTDCVASNVVIDGIDGGGFIIDSGTSGTGNIGAASQRIAASNITVHNYGQGTSMVSAAVGLNLEGAANCAIANVVLSRDVGQTVQTAPALMLQEDQSGYVPRDNVITNVLIQNPSQHAIGIISGINNLISNVSVHNVGMRATGSNYAVLFSQFGNPNSGITAHNCEDNTIRDLHVFQDASTGQYAYTVYFDDGGQAHVTQRNRVHCVRAGTPATAYSTYTATAYVIATGANANILDLDTTVCAAPTAVFGSNAGTTPPNPVIGGIATDTRGQFTFGTGGSATGGDLVDVTFGKPFGIAPEVRIRPTNGSSAVLNLYVTSVTTAGFSVNSVGTPSSSQANTVYGFTYLVTT